MMAAVAEKQADRVVVTSDNPRSEKPGAIISQILLGLARPEAAQVEPDRAEGDPPRRWPRPRPKTSCCWPAAATRPGRRSPASASPSPTGRMPSMH